MSKSDLSTIEKKVFQYLEEHFQYPAPVSLVIGVSGGADSMSLLHILHVLGIDLHAVHLNYQKRGRDSDKDAKLVEQTAGMYGIDYEILTVDPAEAEGKNFQQWAREVRYRAFKMKAEQTDAAGIVTAHHMDDQLETILQKIFRGSGLASWSAMRIWDGQFFRPLLDVSRNEIEAYCENQSIAFRDDESNFSSDFARNFLRNKWLPELEEHFPGWRQNVLRVAEQANIFGLSLRFILDNISDDKDRLNRKIFLQLNEQLQKSVLIYYVKQIDESGEISRNALKELSKLGKLQTGKSLQLAAHFSLLRDREFFKLVLDTGETAASIKLKKEDLRESGISYNELTFCLQPYREPDFEHELYIDASRVSWPLQLRHWSRGDRFLPFGMDGHQLVAHHLTNRKVGALVKKKALVLESFEETICAVIFPSIKNRPPGTISEKVRCSSSTRECLIIKRNQ